jgi:hypothetical protein
MKMRKVRSQGPVSRDGRRLASWPLPGRRSYFPPAFHFSPCEWWTPLLGNPVLIWSFVLSLHLFHNSGARYRKDTGNAYPLKSLKWSNNKWLCGCDSYSSCPICALWLSGIWETLLGLVPLSLSKDKFKSQHYTWGKLPLTPLCLVISIWKMKEFCSLHSQLWQ